MKKILLLFVIFFVITNLSAMKMLSDNELKNIGLSDPEIAKIKEIYGKYDKEKKLAIAELNIYKAKIEKELLAENVNITEIEKLLRESHEWKIKAEMAEIKIRVETKKLLGEDKWQKMVGFFMKKKFDDDGKKDKNKNNDKDKNKEKNKQ